MKIPILDLTAQYKSIKTDIDAAVKRVIDSQHFILGPEVEAFENEVAAYCSTKYAAGVASGCAYIQRQVSMSSSPTPAISNAIQ